ncbi:hypothetical protein AAFF_G00325010 [Aldrovandia affinis]|uniref:Somatostatin/Cortistatin C-terminal domain-containing protein n=1 Tax=Aldrovandia affinis TaxID=143900 RepID=A0AAD7X1E5_9TELE|nr:hypothetical protein AAFF_G00325010 [Aldrovandia affinis]
MCTSSCCHSASRQKYLKAFMTTMATRGWKGHTQEAGREEQQLLQVLLVALSASVLLANRINGPPQTDILAQLLRTDGADENKDLSRVLLLKIMSDLMKGDNKVLPEMEELGIHQELTRQLPLSQRERKAGCRNFFWKTFTSC